LDLVVLSGIAVCVHICAFAFVPFVAPVGIHVFSAHPDFLLVVVAVIVLSVCVVQLLLHQQVCVLLFQFFVVAFSRCAVFIVLTAPFSTDTDMPPAGLLLLSPYLARFLFSLS
jgi:hypothetical protein